MCEYLGYHDIGIEMMKKLEKHDENGGEARSSTVNQIR
jgi:hypothetical protein